jgi:hypothetical protein
LTVFHELNIFTEKNLNNVTHLLTFENSFHTFQRNDGNSAEIMEDDIPINTFGEMEKEAEIIRRLCLENEKYRQKIAANEAQIQNLNKDNEKLRYTLKVSSCSK